MLKGRARSVTALVMVATILVGVQGAWVGAGPSLEVPRRGGVVRVGIPNEPSSLEPHQRSTALTERMVGWHIYEGLYTTDGGNTIVPLLADAMPSLTENGRVYRIKLRKGIKFHSGQEMTAEDVVASLSRWVEVGGRMGQLVALVLEDPKSTNWVRAVDQYTIEARFAKPNLAFLQGLSTIRQGAYIIPKRVAEKYGKRTDWQPQDYVGTGPFRLQRWVPGREIRLQRYPLHKPRDDAPIGYGGARVAYLDAIEFIPIPEATVRAAELEVGRTQVIVEGSVADLTRLRANPNLLLVKSTPGWYDHIYVNLRNGPFAVKEGEKALKLRQALVAAINVEEIAKATYGDPDVYRLDPGMMWKETLWWTDACKEFYNQSNPQRARQLLQEAGYRGERIRFRTTKELGDVGTWSEVVAKQLRDVGFNVETQVMDYTSYVGRWFANDGWELSALVLTYRDDPLLLAQLPLSDIFARPTRAEAPDLYALMERLATEFDPNRRRMVMADIQCAFYRQALHVRLADVFEVRFVSKTLKGFKPTPELFLWNVWLGQ